MALNRRLYALLMLAALWSAAASGVVVESLNEALVPVANKGDKARTEAYQAALTQVLVKMTGDRKGIAAHPELLKEAANLVLQYQYRESAVAESAAEAAVVLWVQFDDAAVHQLLVNAGLPIWQADRPRLLLWLVTEQSGAMSLTSATDNGAPALSVRQAAERRGLPLVLPQLDTEEQARIGSADIKQNDTAKVRAASSSYDTHEIASGIVSQGQDSAWRGRFTLLRGEHGQTWVAQGTSADAVIAQGIDQIADALAAPVAAATGDTTQAVDIRIEGLNSLQQLARAESFLRTVPGISRVTLVRLEQAQVIFRVLATGGQAGVAKAIAAGQVLIPAGAEPDAPYRLSPDQQGARPISEQGSGSEAVAGAAEGAQAAPAPEGVAPEPVFEDRTIAPAVPDGVQPPPESP